MRFPPPHEGSRPSLDQTGRQMSQPGSEFILPPPREDHVSTAEEVARQVGEHLAQWGDTADWAAGQAQNLGEVVQDYGTTIEDLGKDRVMPWAVPTVAPLSESLNRRADATFQLQGFMSLANPLAGNTRGADGHFHALTGDHVNAGRVETRLAGGWTEGNRTYLAFVTPSVTRLYNGIDFMVGATSSTPAVLDFALFRTDENRQLTSLIGTQRVEPAEVGTGRQVVSRTFTPILVQQGEYIAIAVRQWASGEQRPLLGVYDVDRPLKNSTFPRKITATWIAGMGTIPSVIDGEYGVDFEADWFIPYIELSEDIGVDYKVFSEAWPDVGEAQRPWVNLTSPGIRPRGGWVGASGNGWRAAIYDTPLSTDHVRIRSSIHPSFDSQSTNTHNRATLIVRSTNDMRSGVGLSAVGRSRYELIEWSDRAPSSDWKDRTVLRTINVAPTGGDRIEIDYLDGIVHVRIAGVERIAGQAVGGPQGAAGRFVGVQTSRASSLFASSISARFGPWSARDLPQGSDDDDDEGDGDGETG